MPTRSARPPVRARLFVESLEDRLAPATFNVTTTNDAGAGSLRAVILAANAAVGADAIEFDIAGAGVRTINLASALPAITGQVAIKGHTQPGFFTFPLIELNGTGAGVGAHGLVVNAAATGTVVRGLIINRFDGDGVHIRASNCIVASCLIGTDGTGAIDRGNGAHGVHILGGADGVRVGGNTTGLGNLISGNENNGVRIEGVGTTGNRVQGNLIGTAANGTVALGNGNTGLNVSNGSSGNIIGGTGAEAGNVVSGNTVHGLLLTGTGTTGNVVRGNLIGTDRTGTLSLGNGSNGVFIAFGANGTTIGGTIEGARNIISGNAGNGVSLFDVAGTIVQGNYIGTDLIGLADLGNGSDGVRLVASGNTIGGTGISARNVISGNGGSGVEILGGTVTSNRVRGNYIGTNAGGFSALGNDGRGVSIESGAHGNVIGGSIAGARNVISGNGLTGVVITGAGTDGNIVLGNFIGTSGTGAVALGNTNQGIAIVDGAAQNVIGGTTPGARNTISGNGINGVLISDLGTTGNTVLGNRIGTNATGDIELGNSDNGILIDVGANNNLIGGPTPAARNVISGNTVMGVLISGAGTEGNKVQGNYIGTDKTGLLALPNTQSGVRISSSAANNTIGGTAAGTGNVISGNGESGIRLNADSNRIRGNRIGLAATTNDALGNDDYGVHVQSSFNSIGGTVAGAGNIIAHNGLDGVFIDIFIGNAIQRNRIYDNTDLGIDLGDDGVTANDANDADNGPNFRLNFPVLNSVTIAPAGVRVTGSINTVLDSIIRIEFFSSPAADGSAHGEGNRYLGFVLVQVLGSNTVNFTKTLAGAGVLPGQVITATATDQAGNTSEFSLALLVA